MSWYFCNMKTGLLFIVLLLCITVRAQETVKYYDHEWKSCDIYLAQYASYVKQTDSGWLRNDFFVATQTLYMTGLYRDSETKTGNGWFRFFYSNGMLKSMGKEFDNKKTGTWLSYHPNGMISDSTFYDFGDPTGISLSWHSNGFMSDSLVFDMDYTTCVSWYNNGSVSSAGRLRKNRKTAIWQYFHKNGQLAAREKYDDDKLISGDYFDENGNVQTDTTNINREASFRGGSKGWEKFVYKTIYFPPEYKLSPGDKATVLVTALIDEDGKVTDPFVELPLHPAFDKIAISIFMQSPKWIPAKSHNRTVSTYVREGITFLRDF